MKNLIIISISILLISGCESVNQVSHNDFEPGFKFGLLAGSSMDSLYVVESDHIGSYKNSAVSGFRKVHYSPHEESHVYPTENYYHIARKVNTKLPYFGFEVLPENKGTYSLQTVLYLPSEPKSTSGNLKGSPQDFESGIKSKTNVVNGRSLVGYRFEPGDPTGEYTLAVFIDGEQWQVVKFDVFSEEI